MSPSANLKRRFPANKQQMEIKMETQEDPPIVEDYMHPVAALKIVRQYLERHQHRNTMDPMQKDVEQVLEVICQEKLGKSFDYFKTKG